MKRSTIWPPLMLAVVFGGPALLAALAYFGAGDWLRDTSRPHGELIASEVAIPPMALATPDGSETRPDWHRYRWSLLYARSSVCDQLCIVELDRLARVRVALGRDYERVQLALLLADPVPALDTQPGLIVARLDSTAGRAFASLLGPDRIRDGRVFIVDPNGHLVTTYPAGVEPKAIHADLKRLLRVSKIG
jgi:cytochrome oxidase Cu insertion factor (SCO1/SenC/PrrC family)